MAGAWWVEEVENRRRDIRWLHCTAIRMHYIRHDFFQVQHQSAQADDTELRNFEGRMLAGKESWRQLLKHSFALLNDLCTVFVAVTRTVLQTWGKY